MKPLFYLVVIFAFSLTCIYGLALAGEPQSRWLMELVGLLP